MSARPVRVIALSFATPEQAIAFDAATDQTTGSLPDDVLLGIEQAISAATPNCPAGSLGVMVTSVEGAR